jgi:hypothetical protein
LELVVIARARVYRASTANLNRFRAISLDRPLGRGHRATGSICGKATQGRRTQDVVRHGIEQRKHIALAEPVDTD